MHDVKGYILVLSLVRSICQRKKDSGYHFETENSEQMDWGRSVLKINEAERRGAAGSGAGRRTLYRGSPNSELQ